MYRLRRMRYLENSLSDSFEILYEHSLRPYLTNAMILELIYRANMAQIRPSFGLKMKKKIFGYLYPILLKLGVDARNGQSIQMHSIC